MMENKTITLDFKFHFTKRGIIITLTAFFLCWHPKFLGSETLTMTTYYPAPYGGYASLLTTGLTLLARDGNSVGIGTPTPGAKLDIKGLGNTAATFGFGMRNSDNAVIMVARDDGNVGIGTGSPVSKLQVSGGIQMGDDLSACIPEKAGTLRWHSGGTQVCDGSAWGPLGGGLSGSWRSATTGSAQTNTYGKVIAVAVVNNANCIINVDGVMISQQYDFTGAYTCFALVPPGSSWTMTGSAARMYEFR